MINILKPALLYKEKLNKTYGEIIFKDKYKYYNYDSYWNYTLQLSENSWNEIEMVSIDRNDNVIGFLRAGILRDSNKISSLGIVNFYNKNVIFAKDLYQFLNDLLVKFNFRKIEFLVVIGNPAEKMYDKYIKKYNGNIVGIKKESAKLQDGKYYDVKLYEIFREDYLRRIKWKKN